MTGLFFAIIINFVAVLSLSYGCGVFYGRKSPFNLPIAKGFVTLEIVSLAVPVAIFFTMVYGRVVQFVVGGPIAEVYKTATLFGLVGNLFWLTIILLATFAVTFIGYRRGLEPAQTE